MNKTSPRLPCILAKIQFLGPWWFAVGVLWIMYEYFIRIISAALWNVSALWFPSVLQFEAIIVCVPSQSLPPVLFQKKTLSLPVLPANSGLTLGLFFTSLPLFLTSSFLCPFYSASLLIQWAERRVPRQLGLSEKSGHGSWFWSMPLRSNTN